MKCNVYSGLRITTELFAATPEHSPEERHKIRLIMLEPAFSLYRAAFAPYVPLSAIGGCLSQFFVDRYINTNILIL